MEILLNRVIMDLDQTHACFLDDPPNKGSELVRVQFKGTCEEIRNERHHTTQ